MQNSARLSGKIACVAAFALAGVLALGACTGTTTTSEDTAMNANKTTASENTPYRKITADEGQALINNGSVTIVDVRTPGEYTEKHVPGAINIPVESIGTTKPSELTDTNANLVVYCRTGVRSKQAADKLIALGYQHVNDMGGIVDWHGNTVSGPEPGAA